MLLLLQFPDDIMFQKMSICSLFHSAEQIWQEIRKLGFRNEVFATLEKVADRLCNTISSLTAAAIDSITARSWVLSCFN